jgi:streptogramin lyase
MGWKLAVVSLAALVVAALVATARPAAPATRAPARVARLRVQARIPIGQVGAGIVGAEGYVWTVSMFPTYQVIKIDPSSNRVVGRLALGGSGSMDDVVWITYDSGSLWVSRDASGEVDRITLDPLAVAARIKVDDPFDVAAGFGSLWVPQFSPYRWSVIDEGTNRVTKSQPATGPTAAVIDNGAVWMLAHRAQKLLRIDPSTNTVTQQISVNTGGHVPERLAAGYGSIWTTDPKSNSVARIDETTGRQLVEILLPATPLWNPYPIATGGGSVWVGSDHGVGRINPKTNRLTGALTLTYDNKACGPGGANVCALGVTYANGSAWVTDVYHRQVLRIAPN